MIDPVVLDAFWARVDRTGECWIWTGPKNEGGYGTFTAIAGVKTAHRAAFVIAFGEIPEGMYICHRCDNRACVRPEHLYAGDAYTNARDVRERDRSNARKGGLHPSRFYSHPVHLTEEYRRSAELWRTSRESLSMTQRELASALGTTVTTISSLERGASQAQVRLLRRLSELCGRPLEELVP